MQCQIISSHILRAWSWLLGKTGCAGGGAPVSFRFRHGAKRVADRKAPYQLKANGRRVAPVYGRGQVMQGRCRSARLETPAGIRLFSRLLMPPASPAHSIREEQTIGRAGDETFPLQGGNAMPGLTFTVPAEYDGATVQNFLRRGCGLSWRMVGKLKQVPGGSPPTAWPFGPSTGWRRGSG